MERLQSRLEQERFGGAKILDGRGRGLNHRNMLNFALAQLDWGARRPTKDTFDPYLRALETASLEPNERAVLMAYALANRALFHWSGGESEVGLVDAERAVSMMHALPLDAYRRGEQLSYSLAALSHCLRETGRALEAITAMDEAILLGRKEQGESYTVAIFLAAQATNFGLAERLKKAASSFEESLQMLSSLELGTEWSDYRDIRVLLLRQYAGVLIMLGRRKDSFTAQREMVSMLRDLRARNQVGNPEGFATSLLHLAATASMEEEHEEAIAAAREALSLYRELPSERDSTPTCLKIIGDALKAQGHHDDAIAAYAEAVVIQRELGDRDARAKLGQLIMSLSVSHCDAGELDAATEAALDAVDVLRTDWLEHSHDNNKASVLREALFLCYINLQGLGRIDEAVTFLAEDIELARFQGTESKLLADKMAVLAMWYADLGRADEALNSAADSTDIYRSILATSDSATNCLELRDALLRYTGHLFRFGRSGRGADAVAEAVHLGERLEADERHVNALIRYTMLQLEGGAYEEALKTAASALHVCSVDLPDRHDLLGSVMRANERVLDGLGRPAEAAARQEEALTTLRANIDLNSPIDTSLLTQGLDKLANYYHESGNLSEALPPIQDGVDIHKALWARDKTDAEKGEELAAWLARQASILFQLGRKTDAKASLDEETDVLRALLSESPSFTLEMVAESAEQHRMASMQHMVEGRPDDAMDATRQYLLLSRVAYSGPKDSTTQKESLSRALIGYVMLIVMLGREEEAEEAGKIVVEAHLLLPDILKTLDPASLLPLPN